MTVWVRSSASLAASISAALVLGVVVPGMAAAATTPESPGSLAAEESGPLVVTTSYVTVEVDGRSFRARLSYPSAGDGYPAVAFGHAYLQTSARYASTLDAIAAAGFVVLAPDSEASFWPNHSRLARDLSRSLTWLGQQDDLAGSPLQGKVDTASMAVVGHSLGGGAAVLAAVRDRRVRTLATLGAAETNPPATVAAAGLDIPSLWVVGSADRVISPATTTEMYRAATSPALLASVDGGWHCGFTDSAAFWGLGCDTGALRRRDQVAITQDLLVRWLSAFLLGEPVEVTATAGVTYSSDRL